MPSARPATSPTSGDRRRQLAQAHPLPQLAPQPLNDESTAMNRAPDHESPGCAVPDAAQDHGRGKVAQLAPATMAIATERDVEVVPQEARQGDVPPAPEVADGKRRVWTVEVLR